MKELKLFAFLFSGTTKVFLSFKEGTLRQWLSNIIVGLVLGVVSLTAAHAQTDQQRLMAVMSVINSYLLDGKQKPIDAPDGRAIEIELNELLSGTYRVSQGSPVYGQFNLQEEGVEFCFDLTAAGTVSDGDIVVEVNGNPLTAVEGKDNCYQLSESQQREINYIRVLVNVPGITLTLARLELASTEQQHLLLDKLTRGEWNQRAVRKVLKIFAFGGHATDSQIQIWADMDPLAAIAEMLNFDEHNLKLSPLAVGENYPESASSYGTLTAWQNFISDETSTLPIPADRRDQYGLDGYNFDDAYNRMITVRGLNPFRQKIGFWETNYHLAVNLDANVRRPQMAYYYDIIMQAHEAGLPYYEVLGEAAKSAAAAMQYGHRFNEWNENTQECECNDDFAREIHQLYYGIFGEGAPFHEDLTIPETAKMLTDMEVRYNGDLLGGYPLVVNFQTEDHHTDGVYIFKDNDGSPNITGANAAAKIDNLMPISMQHPESLNNLPVMIISVLADDNLSAGRKQRLRDSWASMGVERNFLDFIHAYATSELLHGPGHFKYLSTYDRALYLANKSNLDNLEAYFGGAYYNGDNAGRTVGSVINEDFAGEFFRPIHNVFGGQTSIEASDSSLAFENNFNRLTQREGDLRGTVNCSTCDLGQPWQKKWETVLPQRADGNFYVSDIAEWLWNYAVGNMDDFTELERAHLYSMLGSARINPGSNSDGDHAFDFNLLMCVVADYKVRESASSAPIIDILTGGSWDDYCRGSNDSHEPHEVAALTAQYTGAQIAADDEIQTILDILGDQTLPLNASGSQHTNDGADLRKHARERVSTALGFIFTTPFVFAEGQ